MPDAPASTAEKPAAPATPAEPPRDSAPHWISDAIKSAIEEVRRYLETAIGFTLRPAKFTAEWAEGEQEALNPFGVLATGAGISGAMAHLVSKLGAGASDDSLSGEILAALAPFGWYAALGLLCHLVIKPFGSKRRAADSLAIALFAGGGPAIFMLVLSYLASIIAWLAIGRPELGPHGMMGAIPNGPIRAIVLFFAAGSFALFLFCLGAGLAALHRVRRVVSSLALTIALGIGGVAFGYLPKNLHFGPHPIIWKVQQTNETEAHWRFDLWID